MHPTIRLLALGALIVSSVAAQAQTSTVKFGAIRYDTHAKTSGISGIGIPPGADADVGDANTVLVTYEHNIGNGFGVELVLGVPPKITAKASGSVAFLGEVMTARNVAPTLFLAYHLGSAGDTWRPYVGVGINYTKFAKAKSPYGWDVKLGDSTGLAAQVGVDYALNKQWGLWASYAAVKVKSKLVATGASVLQTTIDFRPTTYAAGASYRF